MNNGRQYGLIAVAAAVIIMAMIVLVGVNTGVTSHVRINGMMEEKTVAKAVNMLLSAKKGDTINIHIDSNGGYVSAGQDLLNAMKQSKAKVVYHTSYIAMSAAAVPLCYVKFENLRIPDTTIIMFHKSQIQTSPGVMTPIDEYNKTKKDPFIAMLIESDKQLFSACKKFFNKAQWKKFTSSKDVYMLGKELKKNYKDNLPKEESTFRGF